MKKVLIYIATILLTSVITIFALDVFQADEEESGRVNVTKFSSVILNEERELIIRLPRLYDSTKRYPIFYVLDGGSLDKVVSEKLETLSAAGYAQESIIVGIPNMTAESRQKYLVPPMLHIDAEDVNSLMGEGDLFLEFIEREVVPMVEKQYPSSYRIFCGNSRGGLLVAYSLIRKTDLFDARFCFSTPFWRENDALVKSMKTFLAQRDSLKTFFYLSAGSDETDNIKGGTDRMRQILESHPEIVVQHEITLKSIHQDNAANALPSALVKLTHAISKVD